MGLFHPKNIYQESWLLLGITKFLGLYPIKCCKVSFTAYGYVILLLILYFGLFVSVNDYASKLFNVLNIVTTATLVRQIRFYMNIIIFPIILISSMRSSAKIETVYKELDDIDENFKFLNIEIDRKSRVKNDIVRFSSITLITILFNLMDYYALLNSSSGYVYVLMWICDRTPDFVNTMVMCSFSSLISKIILRFKELDEILQSLDKEKIFIAATRQTNPNNVFRLKLLKLLRLKLCKTIALVHRAFGFQFMVLSVLYITYTCMHMNIIYSKSYGMENKVDVLLSFLWGGMDTVKLVYIIHLYRLLTVQSI